MSEVHLEKDDKGVLIKGKREIKFVLDVHAKKIMRGVTTFSRNGYSLVTLSPEEFKIKKPLLLQDFFDEVTSYPNMKLCEKSDIYLATRNGLQIDIEIIDGFVCLAMKPILCMDKKWRILSLRKDFEGTSVISGVTCKHPIDIKRKFIFRTYPTE